MAAFDGGEEAAGGEEFSDLRFGEDEGGAELGWAWGVGIGCGRGGYYFEARRLAMAKRIIEERIMW